MSLGWCFAKIKANFKHKLPLAFFKFALVKITWFSIQCDAKKYFSLDFKSACILKIAPV